MKIISLELENFRNYERLDLNFSDGVNVICGKNGAGKTNILESVYLTSLFSSPRTTKDKEMVKFGCEKATVRVTVERKFRRHTIAIQIDSAGKKKVLADGIPMRRAAELPAERRKFLDVGLSQQQKTYFIALSRYNKVLKQKNNLLKDAWKGGNADDMLSVWDTQLADYGAIIVDRRRCYLNALNELAAKAHSNLSGGREKLELGYDTPLTSDGVDALRAELYDKLEEAREKDKKLGYCTVGPHRDDIDIVINGLDGRKFASQGQQRTIALAMKIGEVGLFEKESGEPPVLLLDDVLSELDGERRRILLDITRGVQTLLTCTEFSGGSGKERMIAVSDGKAKAVR